MIDLEKFKKDKYKLFKGDCLEVMKEIPDKSIDLILCDLPYSTTKNKWDILIDLEKLWEQYERIITDHGAILLFAQTPFDKILGASNLKLLRYEWIWEKSSATGFLNARKMPLKAHENILVFYKHLPTYNPIKTTGHKRKTSKAGYIIDKNTTYGKYSSYDYDSTERYPRSVLQFPKDTQKTSLHPTQKPINLLSYLISTYTNENMIILDNCMGSCSTGIAALEVGNRYFIGIEKEEEFFEVSKKRVEDYLK